VRFALLAQTHSYYHHLSITPTNKPARARRDNQENDHSASPYRTPPPASLSSKTIPAG
jgi:hypothetical protein